MSILTELQTHGFCRTLVAGIAGVLVFASMMVSILVIAVLPFALTDSLELLASTMARLIWGVMIFGVASVYLYCCDLRVRTKVRTAVLHFLKKRP